MFPNDLGADRKGTGTPPRRSWRMTPPRPFRTPCRRAVPAAAGVG